ncbi:MAG: exodeoxyribonuclease V subunit gamma, partial [Clostridia bacterium]|nr:exodeoxyribonuclease V subunit gamma [Clostridia bacterium]
MKANLYVVGSYSEAVILASDLVGAKSRDIKEKNIVFTPEKTTLLLESEITDRIGGYFNTRVYSFGKYLKYNGNVSSVLTREASVMVIRKILGEKDDLKCFRAFNAGIAENLYDSIALLKSAKVSADEISSASEKQSGVLKDKLSDLAEVYYAYDEYLGDDVFDQSGMLAKVPSIIDKSDEIAGADVFLVGYDSWTAQARNIVESLVKKAKSVTAVLVGGENRGVYTNETPDAFRKICSSLGVKPVEATVPLANRLEREVLLNRTFSETAYRLPPVASSAVEIIEAGDLSEEVAFVATCIKKKVIEDGYRFKDFNVAVSDADGYRDVIERVFSEFGIPYYLDDRKKFSSHPLAKLVIAYLNAVRKNYATKEVLDLVKNPLFTEGKNVADKFENYVVANGIKYNGFSKPFKDCDGANADIEEIRQKLVAVKFTDHAHNKAGYYSDECKKFLAYINVTDRLARLSEKVREYDVVEGEFSSKAESVLDETFASVDRIVYGSEMQLSEFISLLHSGFDSSFITILPQNCDSVYVGGYRDTGGLDSKYQFAIGLSDGVPEVKQDIAVLSDREISLLGELKIIIEPKVRAVNNRERELFVTALTSFTEKLYLTYSVSGRNGHPQKTSDALMYIKKAFGIQAKKAGEYFSSDPANGYISVAQAEKTFALEINGYKERNIADFKKGSAYYGYCKEKGGELLLKAENVLADSDTDVAKRLSSKKDVTVKNNVAVTTLESFYDCPFKCFMEKGLSLQKREVGEIQPTDFGQC